MPSLRLCCLDGSARLCSSCVAPAECKVRPGEHQSRGQTGFDTVKLDGVCESFEETYTLQNLNLDELWATSECQFDLWVSQT